MQLVERHLLKKDDSRYAMIDSAAFASKNLYNQANYQIRHAFIHEGKYHPYAEIFHRVKHLDCHKALPAKVSNSILILLHKNWTAFFEAIKAYQDDPTKFTGRPKLPRYKDKEKGRKFSFMTNRHLGSASSKRPANLSLPVWL